MSDTIKNISKETNISIDVGFKEIVFIAQVILVILKIARVINVSWWVIFLPTLIPAGTIVGAFVILLLIALISPKFRHFIEEYNARKSDE